MLLYRAVVHAFALPNNVPSYNYTAIVHSAAGGHRGCFQLEAAGSRATVTAVSLEDLCSHLSWAHPWEGNCWAAESSHIYLL